MNILMLSWRGPGHPLAGGAERVTWHYAAGWAAAGHHVSLFTSSFAGAPHRQSLDGVSVYRHGWQFFGVQLAAFFWYFFGRHDRFDLVVDEFHGLPFFTPLYVSGRKLAFIHEVAQTIWKLNPWPFPFNLFPAYLGRLGEPWIFKLFYRHLPFLTVSSSTRSDLLKYGVTNIAVITNGVDLPTQLPKLPKSPHFSVIYLSALAKDKGIEDAIIAFSQLHKQIPSAHFNIVGKSAPGYELFLRRLCQHYISSPSAYTFHGYVDEPVKFNLLAQSHLLLFPSAHEGWGLVIIEAAAVGTPTVAYNVHGVREAVLNGETGLLNPPNLVTALTDSMLKLAHNPAYLAKLSRHCLSWSRRFLWSESLAASLNLLRSL